MTTLVSSYTLRNLNQSLEFLLKLIPTLNNELFELEKAKGEVKQQQNEAQKQGIFVKKITTYMSDKLTRLETSNLQEKISTKPQLTKNLTKFSETERKLRTLREHLGEFIEGDDIKSLNAIQTSFAVELKQYESFLLELTNYLNEKIATFEKFVERITAEKREYQQQKLLLKEMVDLFNEEINDLENTFNDLEEKSNSA